jgi:hypothetical protein
MTCSGSSISMGRSAVGVGSDIGFSDPFNEVGSLSCSDVLTIGGDEEEWIGLSDSFTEGLVGDGFDLSWIGWGNLVERDSLVII